MKIIIIVLILNINDIYGLNKYWNGNVGDPSKNDTNQEYVNIKEEWFAQELEHFNPATHQTFQQLYFTNKKFYKKGGPVFLMISGARPANRKWMTQGAWIKYAEKHNALCLQLEHRFYGKSHPKEDTSTENLAYLSAEQALTDLVYFIVAMNKEFNLDYNTKWIAFGGSYAGTIATWLRSRFPHLVHGAISSSAPLLAVDDFKQYYKIVEKSLRIHSDTCVDSIKKSFWELEMLLTNECGQEEITEQFKLCHSIQSTIWNKLDTSNLFEILASRFGDVVQNNKVNSPHATVSIDDVCEIMLNTTTIRPVHRLAQVNSLLMSKQNIKCLDHSYENMIRTMQETYWGSTNAVGSRQWTYQRCTGFGFYKTSGDEMSVFGDRFPIEFFRNQCTDIFGSRFSKSLKKAIRRTNAYFGGLNSLTTNVLYVHGSIDPWHSLGLTKTTHVNLPTIYIKGTAHCADMYEPSDSDLPQLKQARMQIDEYISNLLK